MASSQVSAAAGPAAPTSISSIDQLVNEGPIGPVEAARCFGQFRNGSPTNRSTVIRWMMDGIRRPDGSRVKLESYRFGNRLMTSKAACIRFIRAQQDVAPAPEPVQPAAKKKPQKQAGARNAGRVLASMGA